MKYSFPAIPWVRFMKPHMRPDSEQPKGEQQGTLAGDKLPPRRGEQVENTMPEMPIPEGPYRVQEPSSSARPELDPIPVWDMADVNGNVSAVNQVPEMPAEKSLPEQSSGVPEIISEPEDAGLVIFSELEIVEVFGPEEPITTALVDTRPFADKVYKEVDTRSFRDVTPRGSYTEGASKQDGELSLLDR